MSLAVSFSDLELANLYRLQAKQFQQEFRLHLGKVWASGQWGFQYYMGQCGMKPWDLINKNAKPGDHVISALLPWPEDRLPAAFWERSFESGATGRLGADTRWVASKSGTLPLRTISRGARSNFYSNGNAPGRLAPFPYSVSSGALDVFVIRRMGEDENS